MVSLQRIFIQERDDALTALDARRSAVQSFASSRLSAGLASRLQASRRPIAQAIGDPLAPEGGLYHRDATGLVRLPRQNAHRPGASTPASDLTRQLSSGSHPRVAQGPWAERLALFSRFRQATNAGNDDEISRTFREILTHRVSYVVPADQDIPYMVALLDFFARESDPDPRLMKSLLREGLGSGASHMQGLQRELLLKRSRFAQPDFAALVEQISALCEASAVPYDDFQARASAPQAPPPQVPDDIEEPTLVDSGQWYLELAADGSVVGVQTDPSELTTELTAQLQDAGLFDETGRISAGIGPGHTRLTDIALTVTSATWAASQRRAYRVYALKTGLGLTLGALACAIVALAFVLQRRERRFLQLKSDFVAAVSHELRTPLASLRLLAETIERRTKDVPGMRDYPVRMIKEIDGLSYLVENILSFSRLEKGKWSPNLSSVKLSAIVEELKSEMEQLASKEVQIQTEGVGELTLQADRDLLKLVFVNLARNAAAYNDHDTVTIDITGARGDDITIAFKDNGIGIDESDRGAVFDEFHRASTGTATRVRGTGLGLAICKRVMALHGGEIGIRESSSDGTTFELRFPSPTLSPG
jgi:signal transduction histidine kinase